MAKISKSVTFKNATITMEDMKITEYVKDDYKVYDLLDILKDFNGIDGLSFTIKQDDELDPIKE